MLITISRKVLVCSALVALATGVLASESAAAAFKWAGGRSPAKKGGTPGQQGDFVATDGPAEWTHIVQQVQGRFPAARPWVTWAVGTLREKAATISDDDRHHDDHLKAFGEAGIDVFLEIWPARGEDPLPQIDEWLGKLGKHRSVVGISVDLEWYHGVDDAKAEAWDKAVKSHDPKYRLMLKHWDASMMPVAYARKSDVICVDMSSEIDREGMAREFATWANDLAPAAVAFQAGYPWDESWWKDLKDPIADIGSEILAGVKSPTQELGLLWVTVRSPLTPGWDLTTAVASRPTSTPPARPPAARPTSAR
jgi:hypothetical protein